MGLSIKHSDAYTCLPPHTPTYTNTDWFKGMILINSENSLVRGLPCTSHLSFLLESGSTLLVWKWGCINDGNPWKISSGSWGHRKARQCSERERGDKTDQQKVIVMDRKTATGHNFLTAWIPSCLHFTPFFLPSVPLISSTHLHLSAAQAIMITWKIYI